MQQEVLPLWPRKKTLLICGQSSIVGTFGIWKGMKYPEIVLCLHLLPHFNFMGTSSV